MAPRWSRLSTSTSETPGLLLALWELATNDKTQFRERYRRYMTLEAEATSLWHFAVSVLPGLLQTPGYAREVLAAGGLKGEELEQQVDARMGRRELLDGDDAPSFRTILSEAVLRTPLRDAGEWRRQDVSTTSGSAYGRVHGECLQRRPYDAVRDMALTPSESRKFVLSLLEEVPCDPST